MASQQARSNYGSINAERVPNVGFSGGPRSDTKAMLELAESVSSRIFRLNTERKSLEQWQKTLGTPKDSQELRNKIQTAETNIHEIIKQTAHDLQKLNNFARGSDKSMKLRISKLKDDFGETVQLCSKAQKSALDKLRTSYLPSEVALMEVSPTGEGAPFLQAGKTTAELRQATKSLEFETGLLKEREQRIATIEKNIIDINQIMSEVNALVHSQAEDINSIENAIENSQQDVEQGAQELQKAAAYQTRRRKKNCILMSIAVVVCLVLAIIIAISLH